MFAGAPWPTSQPLAVLASQFEKPVSHWTNWHVPVAHDSTALGMVQTFPQAPQCDSVVREVSQPSAGLALQSPQEGSQTGAHAPETQDVVPWGLTQALPHAPQWEASVCVSRQIPEQQADVVHWLDRVHEAPGPPRHPPDPLHVAPAPHSPAGSVPAVMNPHVPFAPPVWLPRHERHVPAHGTLQHTPSTQSPLWHEDDAVQAAPFDSFGTHAPPWQK